MHLMAVRFAAGIHVQNQRKRTNLSALRRKVRAGRKQGRKRGPDQLEMCAPDSVQAKRKEVCRLVLVRCISFTLCFHMNLSYSNSRIDTAC